MQLNGVVIPMQGEGDGSFAADGATMTVRELGEDADWRADAELVFTMEQGPTVGYRGFWSCAG